MTFSNSQFYEFQDKLTEALKMESVSNDIGFDNMTTAILARIATLSKAELDRTAAQVSTTKRKVSFLFIYKYSRHLCVQVPCIMHIKVKLLVFVMLKYLLLKVPLFKKHYYLVPWLPL